MPNTFILHVENQKAPVPASGTHAEALGELEIAAKALLKLIERERSGVFDGFAGQRFWIGSDSVSDMAEKIVELAARVAGERRDAAAAR